MILDFSLEKRASNLKHWKSEINQLYHPSGFFKQESYALVYSFNTVSINKFLQILLKEWFYLVEKDGFLIIDYQPNAFCDFEKLESNMKWLWRNKYTVVFHGRVDDEEVDNLSEDKIKLFISHPKVGRGKRLRFICKKKRSVIIASDSIEKWTFGIVTNGKRAQWIEQIVDSIRKQNIPHYEIIICGTYTNKLKKDVKYLPFNQKDDKGWITKKKNLIVQKAKYENICMLHDRMVLEEKWYKGMEKWGNCFENLGCKQMYKGQRVNDWLSSHYFIKSKSGEKFSFESYVDYKDWYPSVWFLGQLNIFKKSIVVKNNLWWDESLFYGEKEDSDFSARLHRMGFIHRFNDATTVETLTNKYTSPTFIEFDPDSSSPRMKLNNRNAFLKFSAYLTLKLFYIFGITFSFNTLENLRSKIYTFILMFNPLKYAHSKEWQKVIGDK